MFNIDDFFQETAQIDHKPLDSGNGIIYDIQSWSDAYRSFLKDSGKSINTSGLYDVTLNGFKIFISQYHSNMDGISGIGVSHINDFLEWMEEYQVSKLYGGVKERVDRLLKFLSTAPIKSVGEYEKAMTEYFSNMDDEDVDINEYVLLDFLDFFKGTTKSIDKDLIKSYIDSRPKVSNDTMNQRRIAIIAFLKFIDKTIGEEKFTAMVWRIKQYKLVKKTNTVNTGFSVPDQQKIRALLNSVPSQNISNLKRVQPHSEYVEWRTRTMMILMMGAGLRVSEALKLRFEDIIAGKGDKPYMLKVIGKGNKERRVPISKHIFEPYLIYLKEHRISEYLSATGRTGRPENRSNLYNVMKKKLIEAGVSQYGLHIFRHHFGSSFAAREGNIKALQQLLGHSNITTTMIYSQISDNELAKAVESTSSSMYDELDDFYADMDTDEIDLMIAEQEENQKNKG
jgi:integrase/recombinase XerD